MAKNDVIFHFNKKHLEDRDIPMWVIKHRGKTHYVNHVTSEVGFSTKETPDNPHTKGSIKFKGSVEFYEEDGKTMALVT